ncbi:TfoX/Sxy family protein [Salipiger sp. P9]|uniref:TfoX/Sxy family protein n=1 Tax=Salipiger pentaromativorans TaxID=2943193 RepID=UPI0021574778|nr:TfoX/Sxy family protein [Salipiger pentaromativorans]MCR8547083.1 TfoX/Sxy family protein [Salipiger pentaromativorans]
MAYDEGLAETLRDALDGLPGLDEKRMFGALCFLRDGNMICGVRNAGGLFRVGKAAQDVAQALPGVGPAIMGGRRMGGFIEAGKDAMADDAIRDGLLTMALDFTATLPPK